MNFHVQIPFDWCRIMRITCDQLLIALCITCVSYAHSGRSQQVLDHQVTISFQQIPLEEALNRLEKQASVRFVYSRSIVNADQAVSLKTRKASLKKVLDALLTPSGIGYSVVNDRIVLNRIPERKASAANTTVALPDLSESFVSLPPLEIVVKGRVTDEKGEGLPGVSILVKGTQQGTVTNEAGDYTISVAGKESVLIFSFVGYIGREVLVGSQSAIHVSLKVDEKALEEVLVVGYGTQSRETITTSVSKLDNRVLENVPYANAASALQGTLSGVRVQTTTGQPGAAPRVIVRGGTSINNPNGATPLFIVDGIIRADINDLNSNDVASMQVLKDAASTAIYGARGSNGVVIITTKTGKPGKASVSYGYNLIASNVAKTYDLVSARDFIKFYRLGVMANARKLPANVSYLTGATPGGTGNDLTNNTFFTTQYLTPENQHKLNEGWESMPDPLDPSKTIIFQDTDFQKILYRTGISHDHQIAVNGGTEKATFNAGVGYLSNEGIAIGTGYQRLSVNLNSDLKVRDNLSVSGRLMYSKIAQDGDAWPYDRSQALSPTSKRTFEDGTLSPGLGGGNPEYLLSTWDRKYTNDKLTVSLGGHWTIFPGFSFDPQVSAYSIYSDRREFRKAYVNAPGSIVSTRAASASYFKHMQYQADAVFSYEKSLGGNHNISAKAGFSYFDRGVTNLSANGQGAASDLIPTLNAAASPIAVSGSESKQAILGYFSNINYDFGQKYLLTINMRYDGASNLGNQNKWGFFPGVSVGWNLHKEDFWKQLPSQLSALKIRGSYGVNGNLGGLGDYQAQGEYSVGRRYDGNAVIQNTVLANDNLQWEVSKTFDIGADLGLFNNSVTLLIDYYRRVTDNLLTTLSLPQSTGFTSILTNLGSLENKGIEFEVSARVPTGSSRVQWDISFNASKVKNKILTLPYNGTENNRIGGYYLWDTALSDYRWMGGLQEGISPGELFAYKQVGIYATDEEAAKAPVDMLISVSDRTKYGGDVNWLDVDNDGIIDSKDRVPIGNMYPVWTGGFSNSLSYKGLSLFFRLDYTTGHTKYNWSRALMLAQYGTNSGIPVDVLRSWQNQGDVTDIPRYYWADQQTQRNIARGQATIDGGNSIFFESGNYASLREVTLSYSLPNSLTDRIKVSNIRFNVSGHNLHYFTNYKGLSPEDGGQDNGGYPIPRNIIFGVNVTF